MASTGGKNKGTKIIKCRCSHSFQDEKYGKDNRVHNACRDGTKWRCTVCLSEKD